MLFEQQRIDGSDIESLTPQENRKVFAVNAAASDVYKRQELEMEKDWRTFFFSFRIQQSCFSDATSRPT